MNILFLRAEVVGPFCSTKKKESTSGKKKTYRTDSSSPCSKLCRLSGPELLLLRCRNITSRSSKSSSNSRRTKTAAAQAEADWQRQLQVWSRQSSGAGGKTGRKADTISSNSNSTNNAGTSSRLNEKLPLVWGEQQQAARETEEHVLTPHAAAAADSLLLLQLLVKHSSGSTSRTAAAACGNVEAAKPAEAAPQGGVKRK
ncbi:hypothetical protein Emag_007259 [Eimeria magna]